ncbi:MAG TPA: hypothetical protein PLP19_14970 [bacterium]|nr:hypothetical protein [bacterium]HPN44792.1 hypothetical protein [bacterium]
MRMCKTLPFYISVVLLCWFAIPSHAADPCDRACLEGTIDKVLAAMIAHDPNQLMLANGVQYTENGVELRLGDGIWGTLTARANYSLYVCDVESGQAGFYGTVLENGVLDYIALRVKVDEALISEIEAIVARPNDMMNLEATAKKSAGQLMDARTPRPQFTQTVPAGERMSREELVKIANSYFTGLANQTGNFTAPFAETCERLENGQHTTNQKPNPDIPKTMPDVLCMNCEQQQKSGWFAFVTEIRNRRFPIVDRERGLVLSFGFFDHNAAVRQYPLPNGVMTPNILTSPQTIEISELFQIRNGKIDQIEAVINSVPYRMKSEVWDK